MTIIRKKGAEQPQQSWTNSRWFPLLSHLWICTAPGRCNHTRLEKLTSSLLTPHCIAKSASLPVSFFSKAFAVNKVGSVPVRSTVDVSSNYVNLSWCWFWKLWLPTTSFKYDHNWNLSRGAGSFSYCHITFFSDSFCFLWNDLLSSSGMFTAIFLYFRLATICEFWPGPCQIPMWSI